MDTTYRSSRFVDFAAGQVLLDPETLLSRLGGLKTRDDKLEFFECRVEVWQLGVAVAMLREIEVHQPPSIWSHSAYGLLAIIASYFEMIGKIVHLASRPSRTAGLDFNYGFCDVYPAARTLAGGEAAKDLTDANLPHVAALRDLMRNGMYHLGFPKKNFFIHNSATIVEDFRVVNVADQLPKPTAIGVAYLMNPHRVARTLVNHFGAFMTRLRDPADDALRNKFETVFDTFDAP